MNTNPRLVDSSKNSPASSATTGDKPPIRIVDRSEEMILVDKPAGISSFGVVAKIRHDLTSEARAEWDAKYAHLTADNPANRTSLGIPPRPKKVKVGHTGTLDPFATGLLILLVGKGTKRANEFLRHDKEYLATVHLGATSTTGDPEGEITEQKIREIPNKQAVENLVETWPVENLQKVPSFSAVKINGQRAYKLARAGKPVDTPTRQVKIYHIDLVSYHWPELVIRCKVSSGTYIRTLGEDIGIKLGVGAYLTSLRRLSIGDYSLESKLPNSIL